MILMFIGCFSIVSEDFDNWKSETLEIQDFGIDVSEIPAGTFRMGCTDGDSECEDDESPVHNVGITRSFMMMKTEVTQELYEAVMSYNPSTSSYGGDFPVEEVSWFEAVRFANELSRLEGREECYSITERDPEEDTVVHWIGFDCKGWRLPTEAEWEYAARGNENFIYAGSDDIDEVAWYHVNSGGQTQRVAQKEPNGFGLYDITGNVHEWCWDWYGPYSIENQSDSTGLSTGSSRVYRGGSWSSDPAGLRVSRRARNNPTFRRYNLGFRLGRTL